MVSPLKESTNARSHSGATRRSHRKSRNGCAQCKRRHVKCDENRPACTNCIITDRRCSFQGPFLSLPIDSSAGSDTSSSVPAISTPSAASSPASLGAVIRATVLGAGSQRAGLAPQTYDLAHLGLLHHLETRLLKPDNGAFFPEGADSAPLVDLLFNSAVSEPYLMDELLAISALHMSTLASDAAEKQRCHHQAAQLQTRALTLFNAARPAVSEENCIPMFFFSGFIGLHALFDTASSQQDFSEFLDRFIQFLGLHRGIRTVTHQTWQIISQTDMRHIVDPMGGLQFPDLHAAGSETECDSLMAHLTASSDDLGPLAFNACREAVERLQGILNLRRKLQRPIQTHVVMAWPVLISSDYLHMLRQRRPEALVILAYWAVLLHYDRDFWVFGDSGRCLIMSTRKYLGSYWDDWMAWPNKMLAAE